MKFGPNVHGALKMKCDHFGDRLTFHLAPPSGQNVILYNTLVYDQVPARLVLYKQ